MTNKSSEIVQMIFENAFKKYRLRVYKIGKRASNNVISFFVIQMINIIHSSFRKTTLHIVSRNYNQSLDILTEFAKEFVYLFVYF